MTCSPGDVIRIFDVLTNPQKLKLHVCICSERRLFLRINSEDVWGEAYAVTQSDWPFLHHDSYVELNALVRNAAEEIAISETIGALNRSARKALVSACNDSDTLPEAHKLLIAERLSY